MGWAKDKQDKLKRVSYDLQRADPAAVQVYYTTLAQELNKKRYPFKL